MLLCKMLYFIKSQNYLKIGYSDNQRTFKVRLREYKTHNPDFVVLDTAEGTREDEKTLHSILSQYQYRTEWFYDVEEVHNIWKNYSREHLYIEESPVKKHIKVSSNIRESVYKQFGKKITLTGEEIKDRLWKAINGKTKSLYITIDSLKKYGYEYTRRLGKNGFVYDIVYKVKDN